MNQKINLKMKYQEYPDNDLYLRLSQVKSQIAKAIHSIGKGEKSEAEYTDLILEAEAIAGEIESREGKKKCPFCKGDLVDDVEGMYCPNPNCEWIQ
jgi:hypothetical protein